MFQHDNGLVNHVLHDQLGLTDKPVLLADRRQQLRRAARRVGVEGLAVRLPHRHGGPAEHPEGAVRGGRPGRGRHAGSRSAGSPCRRCARSTRCWSSCSSCGRSTTSTRRTCCSARPRRRRPTSSRSTSTSRRSSPGTSAPAPRCPSCCCCSCCVVTGVYLVAHLARTEGRRCLAVLSAVAVQESRPAVAAGAAVSDGPAALLPLVPPDLPHPAHRLRPAAGLRHGLQLAEAAGRTSSGEFRWLPSELTIRPYIDIWSTVPLAKYFVNSLIVAGAATVCSVVIAVFAAYAVSRYRLPRQARLHRDRPVHADVPRASSSCSRCS